MHMFESFDLKEAFARLQVLKQNRGIFCLTGEPGQRKNIGTEKVCRGAQSADPRPLLYAALDGQPE